MHLIGHTELCLELSTFTIFETWGNFDRLKVNGNGLKMTAHFVDTDKFRHSRAPRRWIYLTDTT